MGAVVALAMDDEDARQVVACILAALLHGYPLPF